MAQADKTRSSVTPIVGVLVGNEIIRQLNAQNSRFKSYIRFQMIMQANAEARDIVYIFCNRDVNFTQRKVRGTYFDQAKRRWRQKNFPLPDVVYVRGGRGPQSESMLERFRQMGIQQMNPIVAFDKWALFEALQEDENMNSYLPYTKRLDDVRDLKTILDERRDVYIKGCRGSRGKRVMRVTDLGDGEYEYSHYVENVVRKRVTSFQELLVVVSGFFGNHRILVQQAIDLLRTDDGRLVDFRAEVQRTGNGEVVILGTAIRVGQNNAPITIHSDAFKMEDSLADFCTDYSDEALENLKADIHDFLTSLYVSVEKVYGTFGEIGVDFGIDNDGNIWLIECNAQSAKVSLEKAYGQDVLKESYLNPLQFAKLLAHQSTYRNTWNRKSFRWTMDARPVMFLSNHS